MPYIGPLPETFTLYDIATGQFGSIKSGSLPQPREGQSWYPGEWDGRRWRMVNGEPAPLAPEPPTAAERLLEWRQSTRITRAQFAAALLKAKVLTKADALALASARATPPIVARAIARLDAAIQDEAEIMLMGGTDVGRMDPVILALQVEFSIDDARLDTLFGANPLVATMRRNAAKAARR